MADVAKKLVAVYLVATALAAFVLFIVTPLTHDGSPEYPIWKVLNYFMAAATLIILVLGCYRKCSLDRGGDQASNLDRVAANVAFYGAVALAMP